MQFRKQEIFLALMFFVSGFCALLYQTVWMRLAFAEFGVITPVISVVVSVFMFGLGIGSWLGGKYVASVVNKYKISSLVAYALVEAFVGTGAFLVPWLMHTSSRLFLLSGQMDSWAYLLGSGLGLFLAIFPFSTAMGMTYPVALRYFEETANSDERRFGWLYAFNTAGAVIGMVLTVYVFIELLGFHNVLLLGCLLNLSIATTAVACAKLLSNGQQASTNSSQTTNEPSTVKTAVQHLPKYDLSILFATGFCSMGMEVAWVRSYSPVLEHAVYAFAFILVSYLIGNSLGAAGYYAVSTRGRSVSKESLLGATLVAACLPLLTSNELFCPGLGPEPAGLPICTAIGLSIGIFAGVLGWLTPMIIDDVSKNDPARAGLAYAINIAGCMLGPLIAGYALLPFVGAHHTIALLLIPLAVLLAANTKRLVLKLSVAVLAGLMILVSPSSFSFEEGGPPLQGEHRLTSRDYTATTIAKDIHGMRALFVNGTPMTTRSPITKLMADLPFVLHGTPPKKVLIICLGMGTTFRTALSWGADVTVVELVPGVKRAFDSWYGTAPILQSGNGHIVIDDGRRFLNRTDEKFDVVIIDPPPPAEQPASSLLYSTQFYDLIKQNLKPDGILQQWYGFVHTEPAILHAVTASISQSFPYVRCYRAVQDPFKRMDGWHFTCSLQPLPEVTADEFLSKLPAQAKTDLQEWSVTADKDTEMKQRVQELLANKCSIATVSSENKNLLITDDRPFNEYFMVRRRLMPLMPGSKENQNK